MIFGSNQLSILNKELNLKFWINSLICRQIETWKYDNIKKIIILIVLNCEKDEQVLYFGK